MADPWLDSLLPLEEVEVGGFIYRRYLHPSKILKKEQHFGILRPRKNTNKIGSPCGTIYVLHGGNGNDRQTVDGGLISLIRETLLDNLTEGDFQIVLPSVGTSFLHAHPTSPERSYSDYFLKELLPLVEQGAHRFVDPQRYICGFSMGGQAALNVFLRNPGTFAGVGALFPTLISFDYTSKMDTESFTKRTGISPVHLDILISGFTSEFVDRRDFLGHDPIKLCEQLSRWDLHLKKIYFDVGTEDEFGLKEGCEKLHALMTEKNIPHHFEAIPEGRHDLEFLVRRFPRMLAYLLSDVTHKAANLTTHRQPLPPEGPSLSR